MNWQARSKLRNVVAGWRLVHVAVVLAGGLVLVPTINPMPAASLFGSAWATEQTTSCDYSKLEREVETKRTTGECNTCSRECGFLQMLLDAREIIVTTDIVQSDFAGRFPAAPAGKADAETNIGDACKLAMNSSTDTDRASEVANSANELFDSIETVAAALVAALRAEPPDNRAAAIAEQVENQIEKVRLSHRKVVQTGQCATPPPSEPPPPE